MPSDKGAGIAPAGVTPFGFGEPASTDLVIGIPLTKDDGIQGSARRIDPVTRDYVIDPVTGRIAGMDAVQQQVYLALVTVLGSSADVSLGSTISSIKVIAPNLAAQVKDKVRQALAALIRARLIALLDVQVDVKGSRLSYNVLWTDLSNGQSRTTSV